MIQQHCPPPPNPTPPPINKFSANFLLILAGNCKTNNIQAFQSTGFDENESVELELIYFSNNSQKNKSTLNCVSVSISTFEGNILIKDD